MRFRSKNLLVTGGAGFIGSNFIKYILEKYKNVNVYNLDLLTYAGDLRNTDDFSDNNRYRFIKGDICDNELINKIFNQFLIDGIINFAAESHVDNSIENPDVFIQTNILGVYNLLNSAYKYWYDKPNNPKPKFKDARFHQISTDEVYGSIIKGSFDEKSAYNPNSPYSSSKASADHLVRSYHKTYGLNVTTTISSNNFGENQHSEKLIPKILESLKKSSSIKLYGNGLNERDWIYVKDNCKAIDLVFNNAESGEKYNVGSGQQISNIDLVDLLFKVKKMKTKIEFIEDRLGHDFRYSISCDKIKNNLNWSCSVKIEDFFQNN